MLFSCGPSVKEKEEIAVLTCNIMGESRNMDAAFRIKEINGAREQIGEDRFLGTDDEILESFELGLCNELVLNDKEYEVKLNNALFGVGLTSSLNGKVVSYYENGQLRERANFKDGKEEGFWEEYYENGQLKSKVNYQDGKEEGFWEEYYENGQLKSKVNYQDGKEEGFWEDYYENGQLMMKANHKDGELDGPWEKYSEDGQLVRKGNTDEVEIPQNPAILIAIGPSGEISMNGLRIDISAVRENVERIIAENPQQSQSVVISADEKVSANDIIRVMDAVRLAGVMSISLR